MGIEAQKKKNQWHEKTCKHLGQYRWIYIGMLLILLIIACCLYIYRDEVDQIDIKINEVDLEIIVSVITSIFTFVIAVVSLTFFYKRVKNQDKQVEQQQSQIKLQIQQRVDERFTTAINLLGSSESLARTGAL